MYQCDQCDEAFKLESNLANHVRSHRRKLYRCGNKAFPVKYNLNSDLRPQSTEKPFQCDQCDKTFAHRGHLTRHLGTHNREKPLQCDQCDKSFKQKYKLTQHLRTHSGKKKFQCT